MPVDDYSSTLDELEMEVESIVTNEITDVFKGSLKPSSSESSFSSSRLSLDSGFSSSTENLEPQPVPPPSPLALELLKHNSTPPLSSLRNFA